MKKILSTLLVCALLVVSVFAFASCGGGLNGTYKATETFEQNIMTGVDLEITTTASVVLSGNSITVSATLETNLDELDLGILQDSVEQTVEAMLAEADSEMTGTFEIVDEDDGTQTMKVVFVVDGEAQNEIEMSFEKGSDDKGAYIELNDVKYYKD